MSSNKNWIENVFEKCISYFGLNFVGFLVFIEEKKDQLFSNYPMVKELYERFKWVMCTSYQVITKENDTNTDIDSKYEFIFNDNGDVLYTIWSKNNLKQVIEGKISETEISESKTIEKSDVNFLLIEGHSEDEKQKINVDKYICEGSILSKKLVEYITNKSFYEIEIIDSNCKKFTIVDEKIKIDKKTYEIIQCETD